MDSMDIVLEDNMVNIDLVFFGTEDRGVFSLFFLLSK